MHKVLNFPAYPPSFSSTASERKTIGSTINQKNNNFPHNHLFKSQAGIYRSIQNK